MKDAKVTYATAHETKRTSQVQGELEYLDKACQLLAERVHRLEDALSGVLRGTVPEPVSISNSKETEQIVPIAATIREYQVKINNTSALIESIISRLEV